jgi:Tol biopolymer transport system component
MKYLLALFFTIIAFPALSQSKSFDYAYTSQKGICVYSIIEKQEYLIAKNGHDPCISPDGQKLAYTLYGDGGSRFIQIIDLNTKTKTTLNTHNNNCYGPVWSADGKFIAYNAMSGDIWSIVIIELSTGKITILGQKIKNNFSPEWLLNSKNIAVQDLEKVLVYDLAGKTSSFYNMKDMMGGLQELKEGVGQSSNDRFVFTKDSKKIVFNSDIYDRNSESDDEPPQAVFVYDIVSKKTIRLSPKGYYAFEPIVKDERIFFSASKGTSEIINIYSIEMNGKNFKLLFPGCRKISAKN